RAKIFGMTDKITRVLVPTEKVVEVRNKQKRETEQKFFPGYVLVEMELTDDTWHLVRSTPKVTGFVGSGSKPVPLSQEQVDNIMEFCKGFNAQTASQEGLILPVVVTIYQDRSFTFIVKTPPAAVLLKRAAGIAKASAVPHKDKIGKVTRQQVREIAQTKLPDL